MARPTRSTLGRQVIRRRSDEEEREALLAAQQQALAEQSQSTVAGATVQTPSGMESSVQQLKAPSVLEGAGPPPPEPVVAESVVPEPMAGVPGADGLEPEFGRRLQLLFNASGGRVFGGEGYRSYEGQVAAYNQAVIEHGAANASKWAAVPGTSNHGRGIAMDIKGDLGLAAQLAPQFGLHFPMDHEPWHVEPVGLRQDPSTPPEAYTAPGVKEAPLHTRRIRDAAGNEMEFGVEAAAILADKVISEAVAPIEFNPQRHLGETEAVVTPEGTPEVLEGTGPPPPEPVEELGAAPAAPGAQGGDSGDMADNIRRAMAAKGVPESAFDAIWHRMMVESGGRNIQQQITDVNSGGNEAFGPFQFVQGTFNRWADPGTDWKNPYHQVLAYINAVRGSSKYGGNFYHPALMSSGGWSP